MFCLARDARRLVIDNASGFGLANTLAGVGLYRLGG